MATEETPAPEKIAEAERRRLDAVDEAVLKEAQAARDLELRKHQIDNDTRLQIERLRNDIVAGRRRFWGWMLSGLAVAAIVLAGIAAIRADNDDSRREQTKQDQLRQETAQRCIAAGNIWLEGQGCLLTNRGGAPAPAAS
jgi:hypothetical protein